jgi:hypothetical protein
LLVGREDLGGGEIENNKDGVGIADCEGFFLNYIDRCAISLYFANLVINKAPTKVANMY